LSTVTQGASSGGVVEALLDASCAPVPDRRVRIDRALQHLSSIPGVAMARYLDVADEQDAGCLADLAPDTSEPSGSASGPGVARRFVRPREDLTPASAEQLSLGASRVLVGFPDVGFGERWGALVLGLDDAGVRRVSQFDRLQPVAAVVGWVCRTARTPVMTTPPSPASTTGAFVDMVPHGVVMHLSPTESPVVNAAALGWAGDWLRDHGASAMEWDSRRFLRAHRAPDGRTAPEITRVDGVPRWWRRTSVVDAEGGAILGMLTEFGSLDRSAVTAGGESSLPVDHERTRAALAGVAPPIDDDEWAIIDQVLLGRRLSTAARELHMGERRARESMRGVFARLDRRHQAELAILLRRSGSPA
jgi:hypothetical protein